MREDEVGKRKEKGRKQIAEFSLSEATGHTFNGWHFDDTHACICYPWHTQDAACQTTASETVVKPGTQRPRIA